MPLARNKKVNSVTTAENNIRGTNVQPMVHHVENGVKLITGNLSAGPTKGNNLTKEQSQSSNKSIHAIEDRGDDDDDEILTISSIQVNAMKDTRNSRHDRVFQWHRWMFRRLHGSHHPGLRGASGGPCAPQSAHTVERQTTSRTT